ncbi:MAG: DUF1311 domain-containing protein [Burkholderiales bacterium]|nr:DUF1311 domain-containing protein [Burkholderiales bacterium]
MNLAALSFMFLASGWVHAAPDGATQIQSEREMYEECSAFSQAGMRECLAEKAKGSLEALQQAEANAAKTLSQWDEDSKYANQAKAKLAESNRAFSKYRETQCRFSASLSGGGAGNAHEIGRLACEAELNHRRAAQLRDTVAKLPLK